MAEQGQPAAPAAAAVAGEQAPAAVEPKDIAIDDGAGHSGELDSAEAVDAAAKAGEITKQQAASMKKKLKLKVDGRELEEEIDLNDDAYLTRELQKSKAFDKRMQEFAAYKRQVDELVNMLENDPEGLLEKLGKNVDEIAEKRLTKKLEQMQKSPEQLEKEKIAKELEEIRKEAEALKKEKETAQLEAARQQQAAMIERDIKEALSKSDTVLPKNNPEVMRRIGQAMFVAMQNGYHDVTAAQVIPYVEKTYRAELQELFKVIPEDTIEALIGKEPLEKLRKARVAKAKSAPAQAPAVVDTGKTSKTKEDASKPQKRFNDFFNFNK